NVEYLKENWGQSKGGKNTINKLSKKQLKEKLIKARKFIKNRPGNSGKKVDINFNKDFCEFYGALMGDGCLSLHKRKDCNKHRYGIIFVGHKTLDREYHENKLCKIINNDFKLNTYIQIINNSRKITILNKSLFNQLKGMGFPVGKKGQKLKIPPKLSDLPWSLKKYIIRGLFDTDGCIFARKDEKYRYPHIMITTYSKPLLNQLSNMLKEKGYPVYVSKKDVVIKGIKNTKKWMDDIGSSNQRHKFKYEYWLKHKKLPANLRASSPMV
ncbi:MAG: hypothetical protein KKH88_04815, partial [Nanoarchaeota archaeon]|nr:hypothetical protein [Nanoarchaeota archaeon]